MYNTLVNFLSVHALLNTQPLRTPSRNIIQRRALVHLTAPILQRLTKTSLLQLVNNTVRTGNTNTPTIRAGVIIVQRSKRLNPQTLSIRTATLFLPGSRHSNLGTQLTVRLKVSFRIKLNIKTFRTRIVKQPAVRIRDIRRHPHLDRSPFHGLLQSFCFFRGEPWPYPFEKKNVLVQFVDRLNLFEHVVKFCNPVEPVFVNKLVKIV